MASDTYPTPEGFRALIAHTPNDQVVREYIFGGEPFVFRRKPTSYGLLRRHLSGELDVSVQDITVIGSGRLGFSLKPSRYGERFSDESDVDVLIVDTVRYDALWHTILRWHYPRREGRLPDQDFIWMKKRRTELYWGWLVPPLIRYEGLSLPQVLRPLRDATSAWFRAFRSLGRHRDFARRDFNGRLYRTWDHALLYHMDGLRQIREGRSQLE